MFDLSKLPVVVINAFSPSRPSKLEELRRDYVAAVMAENTALRAAVAAERGKLAAAYGIKEEPAEGLFTPPVEMPSDLFNQKLILERIRTGSPVVKLFTE